MKCNPEKINQFFESDKFDKDTKDFVLKLFKLFSHNDSIADRHIAQVVFLDLNFYEVDNSDDIDESEHVINFYKLSTLSSDLKNLVMTLIISYIKNEGGTEFFEHLVKDLDVVVRYGDWNKIKRKNKLQVLNDL